MEAGFCPQQIHPEIYTQAQGIYKTDKEIALMHKNAAIVEARGYIAWPRLRDIIEFCREMGYGTLGLACCPDLSLEAQKTVTILEEGGFKTISITCGLCAADKEAGSPNDFIEELNEVHPDITVTIGLCLAAEALVSKGVASPKTCFIARDPVTFNNPAVSIYTSKYWRDWSVDFYLKKKPLKEK